MQNNHANNAARLLSTTEYNVTSCQCEPKKRNVLSRANTVTDTPGKQDGQEFRYYGFNLRSSHQSKVADADIDDTVSTATSRTATSFTSRTTTGSRRRLSSYREALARKGYSIQETVGAGTYSKVKLAYFLVNDGSCDGDKERIKKVAVKIIDTHKAPQDYQLNFLPRELELWPKLSHSNIIQMIDQFADSRRIYMVLEYAEKGDCLKYIQTNGALSENLGFIWISQICSAVAYIHQQNISHRDLKLENLLIDSSMAIKICDFGFVRRTTGIHDLSQTYCGSKSYAAPEILKGEPYDPQKADIWAVSVILYIFVTGKMPYDESKGNKRIMEDQERLNLDWSKPGKVSDACKDLIYYMFTFYYRQRPDINSVLKHKWFNSQQPRPKPAPVASVTASRISSQQQHRLPPTSAGGGDGRTAGSRTIADGQMLETTGPVGARCIAGRLRNSTLSPPQQQPPPAPKTGPKQLQQSTPSSQGRQGTPYFLRTRPAAPGSIKSPIASNKQQEESRRSGDGGGENDKDSAQVPHPFSIATSLPPSSPLHFSNRIFQLKHQHCTLSSPPTACLAPLPVTDVSVASRNPGSNRLPYHRNTLPPSSNSPSPPAGQQLQQAEIVSSVVHPQPAAAADVTAAIQFRTTTLTAASSAVTTPHSPPAVVTGFSQVQAPSPSPPLSIHPHSVMSLPLYRRFQQHCIGTTTPPPGGGEITKHQQTVQTPSIPDVVQASQAANASALKNTIRYYG